MTHTILKQIIPLAVVCSVLLGYQYMGATWTDPTASAPANNTEAPINVGPTAQVKNGGLSVDALAVFGDVAITGTTNVADMAVLGDMEIDSSSVLIVSTVCNNDRSFCGTVEDFLADSGEGGPSCTTQTVTATSCSSPTCPSGYSPIGGPFSVVKNCGEEGHGLGQSCQRQVCS